MYNLLNHFSCPAKTSTLVMLFLLVFSNFTNGQAHNCEFTPYDDREFRISTSAESANKRLEIIRAIWGSDHIPDRSDVTVTSGVVSPIATDPVAARVDKFEIPVDRVDSVRDLAYFFVPVNRNNRLVLFCPGHSCSLKDTVNPSPRIEATIIGLLSAGFDVLSVYMPHISEDTCDLDHCRIFNTNLGYSNPPATYGFRLFLDPTLVSLNYLLKQNNYQDVNMVGLSGGGWTTNLITAVDARIRLSFSVAGSMPVFLRYGGSVGDIEQFAPELYRDIAGYPDIYILDGFGEGRKLTQVFNRRDDCCFGEKQHDPGRNYAADLQSFDKSMQDHLLKLGMKDHYLQVIDEEAPNHQISEYTLFRVILPGLNEHIP
jgi:hypothetical protein